MNNYLICFLVFSFVIWLFAISYSGDLFSPPSIFSLMFLFSTVCGLYSKNMWGFELSQETFRVLVLGLVLFVGVSYLLHLFYSKNYLNKIKRKGSINYSCNSVEVTNVMSIVLLLVFGFMALIYLYLAMRTVGSMGGLLSLASNYRWSITNGGKNMPLIGRLILVITRAMSMTILCVLVNNMFTKTVKKNNAILLGSCCFIYVLMTLFSGERTSSLRMIAIGVLAYSICWQRNSGYKKMISIKYIVISAIGAICGLYIFSTVRYFVGRTSQLNILDYISMYAGGPLYSFNRFINNFSEPTLDGKRTFLGLYNNLARLGYGEIQSIHREVVTISSRGLYIGNVYTCFYDYYYDFGLIGMSVLISIYSFIINFLYYKAKYSVNFKILNCINYVFVGTTLFFVSFTEQFFTGYVSVSTLVMLSMSYITYFFLKARRVDSLKFRITRE